MGPQMARHIHQQRFEIINNKERENVTFHKKRSWSEKWLSYDQGIGVINRIPEGNAEVLPTKLEKMNLMRLEKDLPKFRFKSGQSTQDWWSSFINEHHRWVAHTTQVNWPLPFAVT